MFRLFDSNKLDERLNVTDTGRFVFLGSGVYHSTELLCDYDPDKLYPPQGWKSYLALELGGQIVELNH